MLFVYELLFIYFQPILSLLYCPVPCNIADASVRSVICLTQEPQLSDRYQEDKNRAEIKNRKWVRHSQRLEIPTLAEIVKKFKVIRWADLEDLH